MSETVRLVKLYGFKKMNIYCTLISTNLMNFFKNIYLRNIVQKSVG